MEVWKIVFHSFLEIFHSILASSIFHTEISVPLHSIPCPALENQNEALTRLAEAIANLNTSTSENSRQVDAAAVSAVSVKLPEFWPEDSEVWFVKVNLHSIRFSYVFVRFFYVFASS